MSMSAQKTPPIPLRFQDGVLNDVDAMSAALMLSRPDVIRLSVVLGLPHVIKRFQRDEKIPAPQSRMRKCIRANAGFGKAAA